ncbi:MAG: hypothetical protein ACLTAO_00220 [Christensenellales bacterium]
MERHALRDDMRELPLGAVAKNMVRADRALRAGDERLHHARHAGMRDVHVGDEMNAE